jgi:hypothetical protein
MTMAGVLGVSVAWLLEGGEGAGASTGDEVTPEDLRGRIELARGLINRALVMLEGVESILDEPR